MPEKPFPGGIGERGVFRTRERQAEKDENDAADIAQVVADPRAGAVFLSLVNRLSTLEAEVRGQRLKALGAVDRAETLVIDNEEAQDRIAELEAEVLAQGKMIEELEKTIADRPSQSEGEERLREIVNRQGATIVVRGQWRVTAQTTVQKGAATFPDCRSVLLDINNILQSLPWS